VGCFWYNYVYFFCKKYVITVDLAIFVDFCFFVLHLIGYMGILVYGYMGLQYPQSHPSLTQGIVQVLVGVSGVCENGTAIFLILPRRAGVAKKIKKMCKNAQKK